MMTLNRIKGIFKQITESTKSRIFASHNRSCVIGSEYTIKLSVVLQWVLI